jgi:hypothetical protein
MPNREAAKIMADSCNIQKKRYKKASSNAACMRMHSQNAISPDF